MPKPTLLALVAILLLGSALRIQQAAGAGPELRSNDERSYVRLALDLSRHGSYGDGGMSQPLRWPPGAPVMFAVGHRLDPGPDLAAAYWLQALAGVLLILVTFALAAIVAGWAAGLAAAAVVAVYPPHVALSGVLLSEALGALLLVGATLLVVWAWQRPRWWMFAVAGAAWALTILTRADYVLAPLVIAAIMLAAAPRRGTHVAAFLAAVAVTLTPWIVYASRHAGHVVLVTEGDAAALFVGTYLPGDGTTHGMKRALGDRVRARDPRLRHVRDRDLEAASVLDLVAARHPDLGRESAIRREAYANLRRYAVRDPIAFARMMLAKVRRTWLLSSRVSAPEASRPVRIGHALLVIVSLAAAALALWRFRDMRLALVLAPVLYNAALHTIVVANPRYNLPALPLLVAAGCIGAALSSSTRAARPEG